jgi:hypothetical protein
MEEVVLKVKVEGSGDSEAKVKSIKQQLREAKEAALQAKEGTEEYFQALQKAAGLADQIGDLNKAVNTLDPGAKAQAFGTLINSVAGGFQTITGLYGLLGQKSEDVEKLLLRVQAASALAMGIQSLVEAQKQWATLKTVIMQALNSLKIGIGAATGGITILIGLFITFGAELFNTTEETKELKKETTDYNKSVAEQMVKLQSLLAVAKDSNKSLADRQKAVKQLNEISPTYLGNLKLETINTEAATTAINNYTEALIKNARAQAATEKLIDIEKQILDAEFSDKMGKALFNAQQTSKGIDQALVDSSDKIAENLTKIGVLAERTPDQLKNATEKVDKFVSTADRLAGERAKLLQTILDNTVDFGDKTVKATQKAITKTDTLSISFQQYGDKVDEVTVKGIDNIDALLFAYDNYNNAIIAASNEAAAVQIENDKRVAEEKQEAIQKGFAMAQATANALNSLNDLVTQNELQGLKKGEVASKEIQKKQFVRGKALAMVNTSINTAEAIVSALKIDPTGVLSIINATIGAIQLAAIAAKKFNPESGGDSSVTPVNMPGGGGFNAPSIQPPSNTSGLIQEGENFKVYVVESDITNSQMGVQQNKKKALITI